MKILYVCDELAIHGGLERVIVDKVNWFVEHGGFEVCVLSVNQGNNPICFPLHPDVLHDDLNIRFYQYYRLPLWERLVKRNSLYRMLRERLTSKIKELRPDIIVCTRFNYLRVLVRIKGTIPLIFESHSSRLASHFEGDCLLRRLNIFHHQRPYI